MFLYVCVYIARSLTVFHTNRSIYISSEYHPLSHIHIDQSIPLYIGLTYIANTPTSPMPALTHTHTSPSPSYRAFFISHVHAQRSMFLYVCVYIARSFTVSHTNRSIYISSEVSPSFPRPHRSIYTSLYRIT